MILGSTFTRVTSHADRTSTRGAMKIYLPFLLVPVAALLAWAAMSDWKWRRRETAAPDIGAAARATRLDAERRAQESSSGGWGP
jgi:hypothetical protein